MIRLELKSKMTGIYRSRKTDPFIRGSKWGSKIAKIAILSIIIVKRFTFVYISYFTWEVRCWHSFLTCYNLWSGHMWQSCDLCGVLMGYASIRTHRENYPRWGGSHYPRDISGGGVDFILGSVITLHSRS